MLSAILEHTFFTTPAELLITAAVLLLAEAVKVLLGFGAGLVAVGLLALVLADIQDAVVVLLLLTLPGEVFVVWSSRRLIAWRQVVLVCVGLGVGVPVGAKLLELGDPALVLTLLGVFLVLVGALFFALPAKGLTVRWPAWSPPLWGLCGGLLSGMFGTGGPPLILYYRLSGMAKSTFRGNLMAVFIVITLVRLPTYAAIGLITPPRLWAALACSPVILAGIWAGNRVHLELSEQAFQRLVAAALAVLGVLLLVR